MKAFGHIATVIALMNFPSPGQAAQAGSTQTITTTSPAEQAWLRYRDTLAEYRQRLLSTEAARNPQLRAQLLYFLQSYEALAFNFYVAPRQQYPALYKQQFFMPMELSWGLPNPDFLNQNGFIDGAHTYRVFGNVRGNRWATLQIARGFWGDDVSTPLANVDFDDLPKSATGDFEIFLGPNPPADAHGKYWVKLNREDHNTFLAMREVSYDWANEDPMEVHIEILDPEADAPIYFDEDQLAARIDKARKYLAASFEYVLGNGASFKPGEGLATTNRFVALDTGRARQQGGNLLGFWVGMQYEIKLDEALIIEMPVVPARYWGIQLGSIWQQTTDYSYHQSSINSAQARIDADGKFRAILSLKDPGVPNWLDPAGLPIGRSLLRFYKADGSVVPVVTKVRLSKLRRHLPKDTPVVTPEQRKLQLAVRRRASLRRYGQ